MQRNEELEPQCADAGFSKSCANPSFKRFIHNSAGPRCHPRDGFLSFETVAVPVTKHLIARYPDKEEDGKEQLMIVVAMMTLGATLARRMPR